MALGACCLTLVSGLPEAWRLKLRAIDPDLRSKLLPVIAQDHALSCDGLQLARRCMAYVYFELFHCCGCPVTWCQLPSLSTSVTWSAYTEPASSNIPISDPLDQIKMVDFRPRPCLGLSSNLPVIGGPSCVVVTWSFFFRSL